MGRADIGLVGPAARRGRALTVVAATATTGNQDLKETTIMNTMTAAILGITALTAIILTLMAALNAAPERPRKVRQLS